MKKLDDYFRYKINIFTFFGLVFTKSSAPLPQKKLQKIIQYLADRRFIIIYSSIVIVYILYFLHILSEDKWLDFMFKAIVGYNNMDMFFKMFLFYSRANTFATVLEDLRELFDCAEYQPNDDSFTALMQNYRFITLYLISEVCLATIFLVFPLFQTYITYFAFGKWKVFFSLQIWLPFDSSVYYLPAFLIGFIAYEVYNVIGQSVDCMLFMLMSHIVYLFQRINQEFSTYSGCQKHLRKLLEHHIRVLKYCILISNIFRLIISAFRICDIINDTFGVTFLIQLFSAMMSICLTGISAIFTTGNLNIINAFSFMFGITLRLLIYCYFCNQINEKVSI